MTSKVVKSTIRGQITLPKEWRSQFKTDNFLLKAESNKLVVVPIKIEELEAEEVIFDAERDNKGKGVSLDKMLNLLKKIDE